MMKTDQHSQPLIELAMRSDRASVNAQQDHDVVLALEIAPVRSMRDVARRRAASPHVVYMLDVSGSMTVVTDDPADLIDVGEQVIDGQVYRAVVRRDGAEMNTLLTDMMRSAELSLQEMKPDDQVSVMHFSSERSRVESFKGSQRAELTRSIQRGASLTHAHTNMSAALSEVRQVLSRDRDRPKCVALFTDGMPDQGTEARVLEEARRCAEASIPVHVCAFGDQLSHDFLSSISAITAGKVTLGRDQATLLRQFSSVVKEAQETGLIELMLELTFHERFLPEEVLRGKPQHQLLMRCQPGTKRLSIPLGNLNAGSWQSIYVKGRLLGAGETSGSLQLARAALTYRRPGAQAPQRADTSYELPFSQASRYDHQIRELVEFTLLKSLERDFNEQVALGNRDKMLTYAAKLLQGYDNLKSHEGDECARTFRAVIKLLEAQGALDMQEVQRLANSASDSSTTSSQTERFGDRSSTQRGDTQRGDNSETFGGDQLSSRGARQGAKKARREVLKFDI